LVENDFYKKIDRDEVLKLFDNKKVIKLLSDI